MCYISSSRTIKIATRDIGVIKVMKRDKDGLYESEFYEKIYTPEIPNEVVPIVPHFENVFSERVEIRKGYHSYEPESTKIKIVRDKFTVYLCTKNLYQEMILMGSPFVVVWCIIPKGTRYAYNPLLGVVVSENIIATYRFLAGTWYGSSYFFTDCRTTFGTVSVSEAWEADPES